MVPAAAQPVMPPLMTAKRTAQGKVTGILQSMDHSIFKDISSCGALSDRDLIPCGGNVSLVRNM